DVGREADGIYDRMGLVGAHEILVETPAHDLRLSQLSDDEIELVLAIYAQRITDLKKDRRFKYVTVFKNQGIVAGAEWAHAHSEVMATTFVPRRILYELRSARIWYQQKERCVFCDIVRQEEKLGKRLVDTQGEYIAFCPYASRVPYEIWMMHRKHNHLFETPKHGSNRKHLAALLGRTMRRLEQISQDYHLVVHTSPNTDSYKGEVADYWMTIVEDYHWHFEILPIVERRSKSYSIKEVYFNPLAPEAAAEKLRGLAPKR
ncbi:MAG TPA: DUF4931 domain-containing protein, partial [Candidatus Acidoferrum sp.]|nr:DUF4931 domain-containing protein [Candidatus Acidoferrum sp.]